MPILERKRRIYGIFFALIVMCIVTQEASSLEWPKFNQEWSGKKFAAAVEGQYKIADVESPRETERRREFWEDACFLLLLGGTIAAAASTHNSSLVVGLGATTGAVGIGFRYGR